MARRSARKAPPARQRAWRIAAAITAAIGVACLVGGLVLSRSGSPRRGVTVTNGQTIAWSRVPDLQTSAPPWSSQSSLLPQRLEPSGLTALTMEGAVLHQHEHLDLYVNGQAVSVPAEVGIDQEAGFLTELHTHDASGIIHVESPVEKSFMLGQFFCEWGVKLDARCLGSYQGTLRWWVNGKRMQGNPALLQLGQHEEIVIAAGRPPTTVPASYDFPIGL